MLDRDRYPLASFILLAAVPTSCLTSYLLFLTGVDWITAVAVIIPLFVCFCWIFTTIRAAHLVGVYFWSTPSTYASLFGGVACFLFLIIAAATSQDKATHQFHAGRTMVAIVGYVGLMLWTVWHNKKRTGSALLAISLSFLQSLALFAVVGAILSWLNAIGIRKYEREHGSPQ